MCQGLGSPVPYPGLLQFQEHTARSKKPRCLAFARQMNLEYVFLSKCFYTDRQRDQTVILSFGLFIQFIKAGESKRFKLLNSAKLIYSYIIETSPNLF